jgi:hypothetical protein
MSMNRRLIARLAVVASIAAVGGLGWFLGVFATAQPVLRVEEENLSGSVTVWSAGTDAIMRVELNLAPSGRLYYSVSTSDDSTPYEPDVVALELYGSARLQDIASNKTSDKVRVDTGGPDTQWVVLTIERDSYVSFSGSPAEAWTAEAISQRIASTPPIYLAASDEIPLFHPSTQAAADLNEPAAGSVISLRLERSASEKLEFYSPDDEAEVLNIGVNLEEETSGGVAWSAGPSEGQSTNLPPVEVRYSKYQGLADSQRLLLISGLLLGVAASLMVEVLITWAAENRTSVTP